MKKQQDYLTIDGERRLVGRQGMIYLDSNDVLIDSQKAYSKLVSLGLAPLRRLERGEEVILPYPEGSFGEIKKLIKVPRRLKAQVQLYKRFTV